MERATILLVLVFVGHGHLQQIEAEWEKGFRLCNGSYFILSLVSCQIPYLLHTARPYSFNPVLSIQSKILIKMMI